jgi:hypothetical protein
MFSPNLKLKKKTWDRVKRVAEAAGYSSPQEFVEHIIEKELDRLEEGESNEELMKKLKGLGYID